LPNFIPGIDFHVLSQVPRFCRRYDGIGHFTEGIHHPSRDPVKEDRGEARDDQNGKKHFCLQEIDGCQKIFRTSQAGQGLLLQGRRAEMKVVRTQESERQQGNEDQIEDYFISQL
jgi:hypothetical protein